LINQLGFKSDKLSGIALRCAAKGADSILQMETQMVQRLNLASLPADELWLLHEEIGRVLSVRLTTEKLELEKRLARLRGEAKPRHAETPPSDGSVRHRRSYPQVLPKYRNPNLPTETWAGRGKQPRWLVDALKTGHHIEEFAIVQADAAVGKSSHLRHKGRAPRL
jgi:DNA-binding protein H-NS